MRAACLIPATRPETIAAAEASAKADGWEVLVKWDREHRGVSATRNALFEQARDEGFEVVRYVDDDDVVLPHREQAIAALQGETDLVYHDFIEVREGTQTPIYTPRKPAGAIFSPPDAWGWAAKVDALERVRKANGQLWPEVPIFEGYYLFLELARQGLQMKHIPVMAYEYRVGDGIRQRGESGISEAVERYKAAAFQVHIALNRA